MHLAFGHSRAKVYEFGIIRLLALGIGLGLFLGVLIPTVIVPGFSNRCVLFIQL